MEVTRKNFQELYPEIEETLRSATFVSIDSELTGLHVETRQMPYERPSNFFSKLRTGSMDFLCVQFGLAAFTFDPVKDKYSCKVFNFNISPVHRADRGVPDVWFMCQASSIDFLTKHDFDFNKVFYEGIPYLSYEGEDSLRASLKDRKCMRDQYQSAKDQSLIDIPAEHKEDVEQAVSTLVGVLSDDCDSEEAKVSGLNGFIRKLIYQRIGEMYTRNELHVVTKDGVMIARRGKPSPEEEELSNEEIIESALGFSKVIRALSRSGKLIVGHHCLLDVCHMQHKFMSELPTDYEEFKNAVHSNFPWILDTKYLATTDEVQHEVASSILENLFLRTGQEPFKRPVVECEEGYGYEDDIEKYHNAGFDAYVTGIVFICLFNHIASPATGKNAPIMISNKTLSPILKDKINRFFLLKSKDTYIVLDGPDIESDKNHVFLMKFPKSWIKNDIIQVFSPYGGVDISWVSDTVAWVAMRNKSEWKVFQAALSKDKLSLPTNVTLTPYSEANVLTKPVTKRPLSSPQPQQAKKRKSEPDLRRKDGGMAKESLRTVDCVAELEKGVENVENSFVSNAGWD